jgi:hypothetical protein
MVSGCMRFNPLIGAPCALLHRTIDTGLWILYSMGYGRLGIVPFKDSHMGATSDWAGLLISTLGLMLVLSLLWRPA